MFIILIALWQNLFSLKNNLYSLIDKNDSLETSIYTAINIYDLLRKCEFYKSYANMFDQFRITSIRVKVTPISWALKSEEGTSDNNMDLDAAATYQYPQAY